MLLGEANACFARPANLPDSRSMATSGPGPTDPQYPRARGRFKGQVMSKRENEANNVFRSSDRPLTEYEEEQKALRKNLERLRAERLAREKAKSKDD